MAEAKHRVVSPDKVVSALRNVSGADKVVKVDANRCLSATKLD